MKKTVIEVPSGVRYISDWDNLPNRSGLFLLSHGPWRIVDKKLTGCGYTEWVIGNNQDVILASPRRLLLENKQEQHPNEVFYVRNDEEKALCVDKELNPTKRPTVKYSFMLKGPSLDDLDKDKLPMSSSNALKLIDSVKDYYVSCKREGKPVKILVTYDSLRLVRSALMDLSKGGYYSAESIVDQFHVVIDEFQSIFTDSRFKATTEIEMLYGLKNFKNVSFVSATPMIEEYLDMLEEFKDLPYYELDWVTQDSYRVIRPHLDVKMISSNNSINNKILYIINKYYSGNYYKFNSIAPDGTSVIIESKEAVFYVNSVKTICECVTRAIRDLGVGMDQICILCAKTDENISKIRKALSKVKVKYDPNIHSKIPLRHELRKMFTFCTRTVYLGADFYSDNARSFIFSDANIDTLAVDISLDLPQILGRQRLDTNPWKNTASLYFKETKTDSLTKEILKNKIELKKSNTDELLKIYNCLTENNTKRVLLNKYYSDLVNTNYKDDYVAINTKGGKDKFPCFNLLTMVAEMRAFDVQQIEYANRFQVFANIKKTMIVGTSNSINKSISESDKWLEGYYEKLSWDEKARYLCEAPVPNGFDIEYFLNQIQDDLPSYYRLLGPKKMKSLSYRKHKCKKYLDDKKNFPIYIIAKEVYSVFKGLENKKVKLSDIKNLLGTVYSNLGYDKEGFTASDILDYFEVLETTISEVDPVTNKRIRYKALFLDKKKIKLTN